MLFGKFYEWARRLRGGEQARRQLAALAMALALGLVVIGADRAGALQRLEQIGYDQRMVWARANTQAHPSVAVVLIDEASLQALDPLVGRFPWPRAVYADIIEFFTLGGAKAIVFDVLFTEQELGAPAPRLSQATLSSGRVVHAFQLFHDAVVETERRPSPPMPEAFRQRHAVPSEQVVNHRGTNQFLIPQTDLYTASAAMGVVDMEPDSDGIYRRMRLFHRYGDAMYPSLAIASLVAAQRQSPTDGLHTAAYGGRAIPLDTAGYALINHVAEFEPYSFAGIYASIQALYRGDLAGLLVSPEEFKDRVVFIGASAVGLADVKATSLSPKAPGVTLHASLLSNLLAGDLLRMPPHWLLPLLVLALAAVTSALVLATSSFLFKAGGPLLLALAYAGWTAWQFTGNVVYPLAAPLAAILSVAMAMWAFLAVTEGRDKRRVRAMFAQYVSPAVLTQVAGHYGDLMQAEIGQSERLTVLFSDIRGFTSISERLAAEQVVDLLNTHFSAMNDVIFEYEGTLDKFIGDAIMAFWGAPIRVADHAERAVRAALRMERELVQVNQRLATKGFPAIDVGIGINTGDAVLGNIGSEKKLSYTAIGDTVNIASRLEGMTKGYGQRIVISEYTLAEIAAEIPCVPLDLVRVKGKARPIATFAPLALPEDDPDALAAARAVAERATGAFQAYLDRRWGEAIAQYRQLPESQAALRDIFVSRCESFSLSPPADDWDGVYVLTTK